MKRRSKTFDDVERWGIIMELPWVQSWGTIGLLRGGF